MRIAALALLLLVSLGGASCGSKGPQVEERKKGPMYYTAEDNYIRVYNTPYGDRSYPMEAAKKAADGKEMAIRIEDLKGKIAIIYNPPSSVRSLKVDGQEVPPREGLSKEEQAAVEMESEVQKIQKQHEAATEYEQKREEAMKRAGVSTETAKPPSVVPRIKDVQPHLGKDEPSTTQKPPKK